MVQWCWSAPAPKLTGIAHVHAFMCYTPKGAFIFHAVEYKEGGFDILAPVDFSNRIDATLNEFVRRAETYNNGIPGEAKF